MHNTIYNVKRFPNIVRFVGLILDIIGTFIIASVIWRVNENYLNVSSLQEFEQRLRDKDNRETQNTIFGIIMIIMGFILIFASELMEAIKFEYHL
jgi:multisubunit Na+/H+ antiporter MnhG subunit